MGWDAIVAGEARFPKGALETWTSTVARFVDYDWPRFIADGLVLGEDEDADDEAPLVSAVLESDLEDPFGTTDVQPERVVFRYFVDNSNYWQVAERVVRLICAAAQVGASGRVLFCDAGDAIALNTGTGGLILLEDGEVTAREMKEKLSPADRQWIDEATARLTAPERLVAAAQRT